jgi:uncharacterized protein YutE (UPF0331/DUF86 family)
MEESDKNHILSKFDEMMGYAKELQGMLPDKEEYLQDLIRRRACEKTAEVAIESLIDVSAMVISAQRLGLPANEDNIFEMLVKATVLNKEQGKRLKDLKGFRNILIHRYAHIEDEIVHYNLINHLDDFI